MSLQHFLRLGHYTPEALQALLASSAALRTQRHSKSLPQLLSGRTMGMIFQKRSTRTRVSTEAGVALLGGHAVFLGKEDIQLGVNESVQDTAQVLSRFHDVVLARVFKHSDVEELAKHSTVPIINGLSDLHHPLQALADLLTIQQHFPVTKGLKIAWVGDGNNVLHSLLETAPKMQMHISVATPPGYLPNATIVKEAQADAARYGTRVELTNNPREAVKGANVIVTDTWISMGDEAQKEERLRSFAGFQVTNELLKHASPDWKFLHCLPRKPEEVSDEVFRSPRSLVWDEAENRMYTVMAVILDLLKLR
ncbi:ornithine carbamoyltransferase [Capsaspora owczarzaki ATCC 30864]|uniref:ornithine carbamoyltransferase n=1 Tax=Capsaspora owczarzaki (strain ATCC 30864) TaxID=595528 RepID=A0A0D2VVJ9_CAPO3|nr:ornithine carbamoyltransferase [Capsaspora owczarzaki ATCC 30864]KJE95512.1 ornithine carbamoyltransferase [Capsaspora owczarzaki ATCC 30864]|eukprot:XP_004345551.1 ornithine carbamoyltransferase [Capsaspora owczarzaki ATCC 30864]